MGFGDGVAPLRGTGLHPLYSLDRDDWVRVRDLQIGERLQTAEGAVSVEALEKVRGLHRVFNLEVEGDHEFLIGDAQIRAHNKNGVGGGRAKAEAALGDELSALAKRSQKKLPATTIGAHNPKTGLSAADSSHRGCCAEVGAAAKVGGNPKDVIFTKPVRARTGQTVPVCKKCQEKLIEVNFRLEHLLTSEL